MVDRKKAIEGLELCLEGLCDICPYKDSDAPGGCKDELMYDSMRLLETQEPRVMTLEEACGKDYCYFEYRATGYIEPASLVISGMLLNGKEPIIEVYRIGREGPAHFLVMDYGRGLRCWDKMPTDDQKEATTWQ